MSSVSQVVGHELREQRPQVAIGQDDHVVEQLAANGRDEALGNSVLPRAAEASPHGLDAHGPEHGQYLRAEGLASIEDDEPGHGLERERFSKLLDDPGRGRARRYAEPRDFSPPVAEDDQDVENPEGRVGTVKKSMAAMAWRWFRKKVVQL